jgi:hypothetical protein
MWNAAWGSAGYVTELNATGSAPVYSTYLPGVFGASVALGAGQVYVTGTTSSTSFPTTSNAFQRSLEGGNNAFVAVLNPALAPAGQLVYGTYLGGSGSAFGQGMAVDGSGNVYVTGVAGTNFPTTRGAFQTRKPGAANNAFVAKINPSQSGSASLVYSTYLGSRVVSDGFGIAVDSSANAYVTGSTENGFPVTKNAIQSSLGRASIGAFVATLNASGSALLFSTYLGGTNSGNETYGLGIALDGSGNIYVAGDAGSSSGTYPVNFPTTSGAVQTAYGGGTGDAFVAEISAVVSAGAMPAAQQGNVLTPAAVFSMMSGGGGDAFVVPVVTVPAPWEPGLPGAFVANPLNLANVGAGSTPLPAAAGGPQPVPGSWVSMQALLLSMEAGAMGVTKDTLMRELVFASLFTPNGV